MSEKWILAVFCLAGNFALSESWCRPFERADIYFIMEDSYSTDHQYNDFNTQKAVLSRIVGKLYINKDNGIRIGLVTYHENALHRFDLDDHTTTSSIQNQINSVSPSRNSWIYENDTDYIHMGIEEAQKHFVSSSGDRSDAPNIYFFTTDSIFSEELNNNKLYNTALNLRNAGENYFWAIGVRSATGQVANIVGSDGGFYTGSTWASLDSESEAEAFYQKFSGCPTVDPAQSKYYCFRPNFLYFEDPAQATATTEVCETEIGVMYLMDDPLFQINCCGVISAWEFYPCAVGKVEFMVWSKKSGNTYELKGINVVEVIASDLNGTIKSINFTVPEEERISIVEHDRIGWRVSTQNIISYQPCDLLKDRFCPQNIYATIQSDDIYEYMQFDWSVRYDNETNENVTQLTNRGYTLKVYANNNTQVQFVESLYLTAAADHWPIGTSFSSYELTGVDYKENITLTWQQPNAYIDLNESYSFIQVARQLEPSESAQGMAGYKAVLRAVDTCRWTASTTFSVETFNGPPIITNFPKELSLLENTGGNVFVYPVAVYDPTVPPDPVCCTLESVRPQTQNFEIRLINNTNFLLYTTEKPVFDYNSWNSYMLTVCCEDGYGTVKGILKIDVEQIKEKFLYKPPTWFYTSIIASLIPIGVMYLTACVLLIDTMFFVKMKHTDRYDEGLRLEMV
ncbi:uncharacterized protein LOC133174071 [Saccostrea echinata]|uniref:uncharacterized protein LOC133174071 n=1 Tax=Saccostrea echinata TaxID=191078 RepID=UPI002A7FE30A|nr:uncharacterized protein LOC133174071 [Saccostrea echinata]